MGFGVVAVQIDIYIHMIYDILVPSTFYSLYSVYYSMILVTLLVMEVIGLRADVRLKEKNRKGSIGKGETRNEVMECKEIEMALMGGGKVRRLRWLSRTGRFITLNSLIVGGTIETFLY